MQEYAPIKILEAFEEASINLATGSGDYNLWEFQRAEALALHHSINKVLPEWVRTCRSGSAFWDYMKSVASGSGAYQARRKEIRDSLQQAYVVAEEGSESPVSDSVLALIDTCSSNAVSIAWTRIRDRREDDPEGCITASRSMVESVCKYILDQRGVGYTDKEDLQKLYKMVAKELNLAPEQHQEQVFKEILGGCATVVDRLAAIRNRLGDAHGKGSKTVRPSPRHAELVMNLAGALSSFLIATHEASSSSGAEVTT